jgi:DNA-binding transcriptional LysR family regulator
VNITLKQLQIFQAVVVAGSITKASRRISLSQPSISQQLAKLEEELGCQLIQRNRTGVISLTSAGEYWFKATDDMLRRLDTIVTEHEQRFVDNAVSLRMGVTPTLRGRFGAAAARIASETPGFVKFDLQFMLSSEELVEQLRLHRLNCVIVDAESIESERSSFHLAELFDDPMGWIVPASVPIAHVKRALGRERHDRDLAAAMYDYVEIFPALVQGAKTEDWYRHTLPEATPSFRTNTYSTAVDLVAEGLATTHCPFSLLPNLPAALRAKIRVLPLEGFSRKVVLAMPRHLLTLPAYASMFAGIVEFCRTEYSQEMLDDSEDKLQLAG